jgi:single-stranded-DNA-specific exonuclease
MSTRRLSARNKSWMLRDPAPQSFLAELHGISPVLGSLLYQRGLRDRAAVDTFLSADYRTGTHDPFLLKGMDTAARRVASAIREGELIAVYGDFDTDGVTAVTLLMQTIAAMGGQIQPYIPHRVNEGYGLNTQAIDQLAAEGVRLLITVDCGISNIAEVAHARALGIDVIVTDHHTPPEQLPDALAVVNPKQPGCEYPFKQLVGVGIAFKLVQALARLGLRPGSLRREELLDVVALGTVADMGPLVGENRVLVKYGLESINATQRPGLKALISVAGLAQGRVTSSDIGFMLGPRLNAAGRLDDAVLAYQLLLAEDQAVAQTLAERLNEANTKRQHTTREVQAAALELARTSGKAENRIVVLDGADFPAGVVGLVAARIVEELARPVLLIERGEPTSRGSARSVPGFSIIDALQECDELLVRYGGHSAAAGFTIESARIASLERRLLEFASQRLPESPEPVLEIDAEVPLAALSWELLAQLGALEPVGQSNPQPMFMSRRVCVTGAWTRGAEGQHLKLRVKDEAGGAAHDAIAFRLGHLAGYFAKHPWIDIAYTFEAHEWQGNRDLQLNIKDLRRAQLP